MTNKNPKSNPLIGGQTTNHLRAFTLMEVLIASAILAMVLVIAVGVISQTSAYQGKMAAMRDASEESRKIADMITTDVRSANAPITISSTSSAGSVSLSFKNGLAMYNCTSSGCLFVDNASTNYGHRQGNVLVAASKTSYEIYYYSSGSFYYTKQNYRSSILLPTNLPTGSIIAGNLNTDGSVFGGVCPDDNATVKLQPYVGFAVEVKTANYDNLPANDRYQAGIESSVTSRSYNQ